MPPNLLPKQSLFRVPTNPCRLNAAHRVSPIRTLPFGSLLRSVISPDPLYRACTLPGSLWQEFRSTCLHHSICRYKFEVPFKKYVLILPLRPKIVKSAHFTKLTCWIVFKMANQTKFGLGRIFLLQSIFRRAILKMIPWIGPKKLFWFKEKILDKIRLRDYDFHNKTRNRWGRVSSFLFVLQRVTVCWKVIFG